MYRPWHAGHCTSGLDRSPFAGILSGWATYAGYDRGVAERRAAKERARTLLLSDVHDVKQAVQQLEQAVQRVAYHTQAGAYL